MKGFTLIEVIISAAIFVILTSMSLVVLNSFLNNQILIESQLAQIQDGKFILDKIAKDIKKSRIDFGFYNNEIPEQSNFLVLFDELGKTCIYYQFADELHENPEEKNSLFYFTETLSEEDMIFGCHIHLPRNVTDDYPDITPDSTFMIESNINGEMEEIKTQGVQVNTNSTKLQSCSFIITPSKPSITVQPIVTIQAEFYDTLFQESFSKNATFPFQQTVSQRMFD